MKLVEEEVRILDRRLHRCVFLPDSSATIGASAYLFHGQGDYSSRYDEVLEIFTRQGVACVATDLPGHGRSDGPRGYVPGFDLVDAVARSNEARCRELCPNGPLGLLGHSAGGLMAFREMLKRPGPYAFSWISSPLIQPEANQNKMLLLLAPVLAALLPRFTVSTHVTDGQCRHPDPDAPSPPPPEVEDDDSLFHSRVSLRWGRDLIREAASVRTGLRSHPPTLPLLLTQGDEDPICPPEYIRAVLDASSLPGLRFREFQGALHEPFADSGKEEVFEAISSWLEETLAGLKKAQTSPSG